MHGRVIVILRHTLTAIESIQALLPEFEQMGLQSMLILASAFNDALRTHRTGKESLAGLEIYKDILSLRTITNNDVDRERFALHYRDLFDNVLDMVYDDECFVELLDASREVTVTLPIVINDNKIRITVSALGATS